MKLIRYRRHCQYVEAQRRTLRLRGVGPYFTDLEMQRICTWFCVRGKRVDNGICHGARDGVEVREFQRVFPTAKFIGTDLFPYSSKEKRDRVFKRKHPVKRWDFSRVSKEWMGAFDLIYSNSLDHARDPIQTLGVWIEQLKADGCLFLAWNIRHTKTGGGDCFGAALYEYMELANCVGKLLDLLYVNMQHIPARINKRKRETRRKAPEVVILVVGK